MSAKDLIEHEGSSEGIIVLDLEEPDINLAQLLTRMKQSRQPIELRLPEMEAVLLISKDQYVSLLSAKAMLEALPTREPRSPFDYFAETVRSLRELERKYGMSSEEFYSRFQEGAIQEGPMDYFEWRVQYGSLLRMKERFGFSEDQVEDA
ncbi:MAG: hypothetical protein U9Q78_08745 [Chloroflexota bacterium]|nr:hypothetical protein [Chloroflexota bacterium]